MAENYFQSLSGGQFALFKNQNHYFYCFADNSMYLIDDWESGINNGNYIKELEKYIIPYGNIIKSLKEVENDDRFKEIICRKLPGLIIDFDFRRLINNFYDQALEDRVPQNWTGQFIESTEEFLNLIPLNFKYWIIDDKDYTK